MLNKVIDFIKKHQEIVSYLIVGGLTTVVSWASKFLFNYLVFGGKLEDSTFIQTFSTTFVEAAAGIAFSYFASRKYVFKSNEPILPEAIKFVLSRLGTMVMQLLLNILLANVFNINLALTTFLVSVFVVIANYVISKFFVFNEKEKC